MRRSDWVIRPEDFLGYLRNVQRLPAREMRIPAHLVLVFGGDDWRTFRRTSAAKPVPWHRWLCVGNAADRPVGVLRTTIGAPAAATSLEEAAALGAREVITFGACGSLVEGLRIGSLVVPDRAYSDEGTSRHYGGGPWSRPDFPLANALGAACLRRAHPVREGGVWTTDAPYRESRSKARSLADRGVVAVDMEAAAIYAVARALGLWAASLMVVSDELGGEGWNAGFRGPRFRRAKRDAIRAVIDLLSGRVREIPL